MNDTCPPLKQQVSVSVVIPTYRAFATVARALGSISAQTVSPLEIIVVDDASDDQTPDVVDEFARLHNMPNLRLVRQSANKGPAHARNAGWLLARGDYVAFLDADDTWHPEKLHIQTAWLQAHPEVMLCGHAHVVCKSDKMEWPDLNSAAPHARRITSNHLLFRNPFITPSVMVRRTCTLRFKDQQRHMEDHLLWMSISLRGLPVYKLDVPLAAIHKAAWGQSGLSAQMWKMERADLGNYAQLYRDGHLRLPQFVLLCIWSTLKFVRRVVMLPWR